MFWVQLFLSAPEGSPVKESTVLLTSTLRTYTAGGTIYSTREACALVYSTINSIASKYLCPIH